MKMLKYLSTKDRTLRILQIGYIEGFKKSRDFSRDFSVKKIPAFAGMTNGPITA